MQLWGVWKNMGALQVKRPCKLNKIKGANPAQRAKPTQESTGNDRYHLPRVP